MPVKNRRGLRRLAEWLGAIRAESPDISVASLEVLLLVAAGSDSRLSIQEGLAAPLSASQAGRALGLLRGRAQWRKDRWIEGADWLESSPHPHIPRALAYRLSQRGEELVSRLSTTVLKP